MNQIHILLGGNCYVADVKVKRWRGLIVYEITDACCLVEGKILATIKLTESRSAIKPFINRFLVKAENQLQIRSFLFEDQPSLLIE